MDLTSKSVVGVRKKMLLFVPNKYEFALQVTLSIFDASVGPTLTK